MPAKLKQTPAMPANVLVVDDDPFIRQMAEAMLSRERRIVTTVDTGARALARLAERTPDLVLLDLGLPDVPGLEVLRLMRAAKGWHAVKILVFTASHDVDDIVQAKRLGASGYVSKPIQPDLLADMVCDLLEQADLIWLDDYTRSHRRPH